MTTPTPERTEKRDGHMDGEFIAYLKSLTKPEGSPWCGADIEHAFNAGRKLADSQLVAQNEALRGALEEIVERTRMVMDQTNGHWDTNKPSHLRLIRVMEGNILIANKATYTPPAKA